MLDHVAEGSADCRTLRLEAHVFVLSSGEAEFIRRQDWVRSAFERRYRRVRGVKLSFRWRGLFNNSLCHNQYNSMLPCWSHTFEISRVRTISFESEIRGSW